MMLHMWMSIAACSSPKPVFIVFCDLANHVRSSQEILGELQKALGSLLQGTPVLSTALLLHGVEIDLLVEFKTIY